MNLEKQYTRQGDYGTHVRGVKCEGAMIWIVIGVVAAFVVVLAFALWLLT